MTGRKHSQPQLRRSGGSIARLADSPSGLPSVQCDAPRPAGSCRSPATGTRAPEVRRFWHRQNRCLVAPSGCPSATAHCQLRPVLREQDLDQLDLGRAVPGLGEGESPAILPAEHFRCPLLVDERRARTVAAKRGLSIVGSGRVLLAAKHQPLIPNTGDILNALRAAGYRPRRVVMYRGCTTSGSIYRRRRAMCLCVDSL